LFWVGQILIGGVLPLILVFRSPVKDSKKAQSRVALASILVTIGAFAQLYVWLIGGQAYPLNLFPGLEVSSSFFDGVVATYSPSLPEIGLGLGGVALTALIVLFAIKILRFLPSSLANAAIDPHYEVT
jgi:Ni/Fe-hydrogenase subunit HybB-like protein